MYPFHSTVKKIPIATLHVITGNTLGDGSIGYSVRIRGEIPTGNARYKIGISVKVKEYVEYLRNTIYKEFKVSKLTEYPNTHLIQHLGKETKLYYFGNIPVFTELHSLWYK